MGYYHPMLIKLIIVNCLFVLCASQSFDFFYFVQQWPPALCDQKQSCCYPTTGKPALDFGIHGLWPNYNNGSYPSSCDNRNLYDETEIEDLISSLQQDWPTLACPTNNGTKFWSHEWDKHGTCSLSTLDEHSYFQAALTLKEKANLLSVLKDAGIKPGGFYSLAAVKQAIKDGTGHEAAIQCNNDLFGNNQLYQVYLCADKYGTDLIDCPILPKKKCNETIEFATFGPEAFAEEGSFFTFSSE
ncbi:unnamed protein product [Withania somnifera]